LPDKLEIYAFQSFILILKYKSNLGIANKFSIVYYSVNFIIFYFNYRRKL